jgi:hypothetical protein
MRPGNSFVSVTGDADTVTTPTSGGLEGLDAREGSLSSQARSINAMPVTSIGRTSAGTFSRNLIIILKRWLRLKASSMTVAVLATVAACHPGSMFTNT